MPIHAKVKQTLSKPLKINARGLSLQGGTTEIIITAESMAFPTVNVQQKFYAEPVEKQERGVQYPTADFISTLQVNMSNQAPNSEAATVAHQIISAAAEATVRQLKELNGTAYTFEVEIINE